MDNQLLQNLKETIEKSEQIAIAVGKNPTLDQMAAALSLYLTLQAANSKVMIVSASEPIVEIASLVGIDQVKTVFASGNGDLIVSFPYNEGEIEKVSYTMDDNFLNIVVKSGENGLTFDEKSVKFKRGGSAPNLLFVIGTPEMNELEDVFAPEMLENAMVVNIDNSAQNTGFGNIVLVSPKFSSLSEQIADLILSLGYEMDLDTAQNLLAGISQATNNFQNPNTTYLAFEIAAILMKKGAVRLHRSQQRSIAPNQSQINPQRTNQGRQNQSARPTQQQAQRYPAQNQQQAQKQPERHTQQAAQQQSSTSRPAAPAVNPPADWLTPKVYKGSTDL